MSFGTIGTGLAGSDKTAGSSWVFTWASGVSVADLAFIFLATDNITTTDGNTNDHTGITDSKSNVWTKAREFTNGQGAAAGGATISIWYALFPPDYVTNDTITFSFSGSITAKAFGIVSITFTAGSTVNVAAGGDIANDAADAGAITLSGLPSKEYCFLRGQAFETSSSAFTQSTNYTRIVSATTSGGGAATNMGVGCEGRILTGTGDTTDPATSAVDQAGTMVALEEIPASLSIEPIKAMQAVNRSAVI